MTSKLWSAVAGLVALAANGCGSSPPSSGRTQPAVDPFNATVDAGETLTTQPGNGAGVFVEYQKGGFWRLWTSCDTNVTHAPCQYQLNVTPRGQLGSITGIGLKSSDYFQRYNDGTFSFFAQTELDTNGVDFTTDPGAPIEVELQLDGAVDPTFLVWYGNGTVHANNLGNGAERSPVVFQPNAQ